MQTMQAQLSTSKSSTQSTQKQTTSDGFVNLLWEVMAAEYPIQWQKGVGNTPINDDGGLSVAGAKWKSVAMRATDHKGALSREILSTAIELLRKRKNKIYPPTLGEFEEMVGISRKAQNEKAEYDERLKLQRIEKQEETPEQARSKRLSGIFTSGMLKEMMGGDKQQTKINFLAAGGTESEWKEKIDLHNKVLSGEISA